MYSKISYIHVDAYLFFISFYLSASFFLNNNNKKKYPKNFHRTVMPLTIVNRGDWLGSLANIIETNKDAKIYVERSTTLHNLLFCSHTLCMNYVTNTFLLVSSSVQSKQLLCFEQGQGQKTEQQHTTKNFDEFHNHSPPVY